MAPNLQHLDVKQPSKIKGKFLLDGDSSFDKLTSIEFLFTKYFSRYNLEVFFARRGPQLTKLRLRQKKLTLADCCSWFYIYRDCPTITDVVDLDTDLHVNMRLVRDYFDAEYYGQAAVLHTPLNPDFI
jgi:hypothetical protein